MPHSPHLASVSSCEQATHSGGCGFCIGFGTDHAQREVEALAVVLAGRRP